MTENKHLSRKYKVGLVICYFGEAPWYLNLFLKSCAFNPDFDFILIGDLQIASDIPANVIRINMDLIALRTLASEKLGMEVNISNPYKLCDLKPAYGEIFSELLIEYDFWGHCDLDILFGEIRGFITAELLDEYDVVCVREEYVTGFFSLFRNESRINRMFLLSKDYKLVFTEPDHYCFDECNFAWIDLMNGGNIFELTTDIESMTHVIKRLDAEGVIRAHFNFMVIEGICGLLEWNHGHLYYADKYESLLYHLVQFKKQPDLIKPDWPSVPDIFFIEKNCLLKNPPDSEKGIQERKMISNF
jgi:hypothetical protein